MSPTVQVDMNALGLTITRALAEANRPFLEALAGSADRRHDLRNAVQANTDKVYQLDSEVKLLKGMLVSLVGTGDGSSGIVPRLEGGQKLLSDDMSGVKAEMRELRADVTGLCSDVKAMRGEIGAQKSWMDGWKGVGVAFTVAGAALAVMGFFIGALIWLFTHGLKP